jgi:mRNA interferase MazF
MTPPYRRVVSRWDVYWANLEPTQGREQAGSSRPVLVVSNDVANRFSDMVTVLPLTKLEGKGRDPKSFEVMLPKCVDRNDFTTLAIPNQIRSIDKGRLTELAGRLEDMEARYAIEGRLLDHLGIDLEEDG